MQVRAISVRQPWAWLIANNLKSIETRDGACNYRGLLAIHASQTIDEAGLNWVIYGGFVKRIQMSFPLTTGKIVALTEIDGDRLYSNQAAFEADQDLHLCPGSRWVKHGYTLRNTRELEIPIAARGWPGLFEIDIPPGLKFNYKQSCRHL